MQKFANTVTDTLGNIIQAATVGVYTDSGHTTLATIYSDNGVTQTSNPLTTDTLGGFFFYAANGRYYIKITKSNITTQTFDDVLIFDPNDSSSTNTGAAYVTFVASGTGATSRSAQAEMREKWFSVTQFGAVADCNGTSGSGTDNTVAFQNAIAAATACNGGAVFIPAAATTDYGFRITGNLETRNVRIFGSGRDSLIYADIAAAATPLWKIGGYTRMHDLRMQYCSARITGSEAQGERVLIHVIGGVGNFQLHRTSMRDLELGLCGTCVYDPLTYTGGNEAMFSVHWDSIKAQEFSYRAFDLQAVARTGNVYTNIYMSSAQSNVDIAFCCEGEESETTISQINVEATTCNNAISLRGVRSGTITSLHVEQVILRASNKGFIKIAAGSPLIGSAAFYYFQAQQTNNSCFELGDPTNDNITGGGGTGATHPVLHVASLDIRGPDGADGTKTVSADFKIFGRSSGISTAWDVVLGAYYPWAFVAGSETLLAGLPVGTGVTLYHIQNGAFKIGGTMTVTGLATMTAGALIGNATSYSIKNGSGNASRGLELASGTWFMGDLDNEGGQVHIYESGSAGLKLIPSQGIVAPARRVQKAQGASVASANNLALGTDGNRFQISGNTQINLIDNSNWQGGAIVTLHFQSTPTVKHNQAASGNNKPIMLAGSVDFVAAANGRLMLQYDSTDSKWYEIARTVA